MGGQNHQTEINVFKSITYSQKTPTTSRLFNARRSVPHPQFRIIHQRLGHRTQVVRGPDHHRFVFHQTEDGQLAHIAHQFRGLLAGIAARDAGLYTEQWVGLVLTLVKDGLAGSAWGGACSHCSISLKSLLPDLASSRARPPPQRSPQTEGLRCSCGTGRAHHERRAASTSTEA